MHRTEASLKLGLAAGELVMRMQADRATVLFLPPGEFLQHLGMHQ